MKIAILVTGFPPRWVGGTETQTMHMARHLAKTHTVTVFTRKEKGDDDKETRDGYKIVRFRYINLPILRFLSHMFFSLETIRRMKNHIDILQTMMVSPNGLAGVFAKRLFGIKTATWTRSDYEKSIKNNPLTSLISKFVIRNVDLVLTQSESIRREVLKDRPRRAISIPNGVEMSREKANGDGVVFVGNLTERKGLVYLMKAIRLMKNRAKFLIVGDGPERKKLERMSKGLGVEFVGKVVPDKVKGYMLNGMAFVFPSVSGKGEGMPNVILEAMSVGLPIVATKVAGIPEIIEEGKEGLLVEERNPEQLAAALDRIISSNALRERMARNSYSKSKGFSFDSLVKRLEVAYSGL